MRELLMEFLTHVSDTGLGPKLLVEVNGEIVEANVTTELADLIEQMQEALADDSQEGYN